MRTSSTLTRKAAGELIERTWKAREELQLARLHLARIGAEYRLAEYAAGWAFDDVVTALDREIERVAQLAESEAAYMTTPH